MDAALDAVDADLLRALIPLLPPRNLRAVLEEIGLGSLPRTRLLEDALVAVLQAVPALRERLFASVQLPFDQVAALLRMSSTALTGLIDSGQLPAYRSDHLSPGHPVIDAIALLGYRARTQRRQPVLTDGGRSRAPDPSGRIRYEPITRAFLAGLGEPDRVPLTPDPFQAAAVTAVVDTDLARAGEWPDGLLYDPSQSALQPEISPLSHALRLP
jgi:hypothetical protein